MLIEIAPRARAASTTSYRHAIVEKPQKPPSSSSPSSVVSRLRVGVSGVYPRCLGLYKHTHTRASRLPF